MELSILVKWNYGQLRWVFVVITPQPEKNNVESTSQRLQKESNEQCLHLEESHLFQPISSNGNLGWGALSLSYLHHFPWPPVPEMDECPVKRDEPKKHLLPIIAFQGFILVFGGGWFSESKSNTNDSQGKNRTWKGFCVDLIGHNTWTQTNSFKRVHNLFGRHHLEKKQVHIKNKMASARWAPTSRVITRHIGVKKSQLPIFTRPFIGTP